MTVRPAELLEQAEALEREAREWIEPPDHPAHNEADRLVHALAEMNLALAARLRGALTVMLAAALDADLRPAGVPSLERSLLDAGLVVYGVRGQETRWPTSRLPERRLVATEAGERLLAGAGPAPAPDHGLVLDAEQQDALRELLRSAATFCDDAAIDDDTDVALVNLVHALARVEALSLFDAGPAATEEATK